MNQEVMTYEQALVPDQQIKIDWAHLATDDPVLQAAMQWLQTGKDAL